MVIPKHTVDQIRKAADIVEIISDVVLLKKTGKDFTGLCPFHSEKTPSFTVSPEKQIFYCFGCGEGGDVFSFVMKHQAIPFAEAARMMARRYGVTLVETPSDSRVRASENSNDLLFEINRLAAEFYHNILMRHEAGKSGMNYLVQRRLNPELIRTFLLGFAPDDWEGLVRHFRRHQVDPKAAEISGLILPRKNGRGHFDRFRNRVMFPIYDGQNRIIGMGGRVLDDSKPKYMNSPETPIYQKSRSLYGLHRARNMSRQAGEVFITEGYMDLLAMHRDGICNSIATLGTAMTGEHIRILKGLANRIVLVFDSDQAGIKAAARCIDLFQSEKRFDDIRILVLPHGHDPDTYLNEFGPEAFRDAATKAQGVFSFLIDVAITRHGLTPDGRIRVIDDLEKPLAALESVDGLLRLSAIRELSEKTGIPESAIQERIRRSAAAVRPFERPRTEIAEPSNRMDRHLVMMMLQVPKTAVEVEAEEFLACVTDPLCRRIVQSILDICRNASHEISPSALSTAAMELTNDPEERRLIARLSIQTPEWTDDGCRKLIVQYRNKRKHDLNAMWIHKIKSAQASRDEHLLSRLLKDAQSALIPSGGE